MSSAGEWDFTVADDDAELLAELRRHGVKPGDRLHLAVSAPPAVEQRSERPKFFGSFFGDHDLAVRSEEILRAEFPHNR